MAFRPNGESSTIECRSVHAPECLYKQELLYRQDYAFTIRQSIIRLCLAVLPTVPNLGVSNHNHTGCHSYVYRGYGVMCSAIPCYSHKRGGGGGVPKPHVLNSIAVAVFSL